MYNIAKVAKGEILVFFNQIFDALTKVWSLQSIRVSQDGYDSVLSGYL
jgi:hypothetical protein